MEDEKNLVTKTTLKLLEKLGFAKLDVEVSSGEEDVIEVVEKFREPGRSLITPPSTIKLGSGTYLDVSHESLMRIWERLKMWADEEAESGRMYLRLCEASAMFQVGKAGLWRPPDLQLALNWQHSIPLAATNAAIPEPATITLALLWIVFFGGWRRPKL